MEAGETRAALRDLQALMASDRPRIPYLLTLSELYKQAGDYEAAIDLLRRYLDYFPGNIPLIVYYADMLIEEKQSEIQKKKNWSSARSESSRIIWINRHIMLSN